MRRRPASLTRQRRVRGILATMWRVCKRLSSRPTAHLEHTIDKAFQFGGSCHGQMSLEDHPIKTMERTNNEAGKLDQKPPYCTHGILLKMDVSTTTHSPGRMPFLH